MRRISALRLPPRAADDGRARRPRLPPAAASLRGSGHWSPSWPRCRRGRPTRVARRAATSGRRRPLARPGCSDPAPCAGSGSTRAGPAPRRGRAVSGAGATVCVPPALPARIPDHELPRAERVAAANRLRAAGESIADTLGTSEATVYRYLRARTCPDCCGPVVCGDGLCQRMHHRRPLSTGVHARGGCRSRARVGAGDRRAASLRRVAVAAAGRCQVVDGRLPALPLERDGGAAVRQLGGRAASRGLHAPVAAAGTRPRSVAALQRNARRRGRPPHYAEWRGASDEHPDVNTAVDLFGTWRAAPAAAGLTH
jgi:hypothetical protein